MTPVSTSTTTSGFGIRDTWNSYGPSCDRANQLAFMYGAGVRLVGLDRLLPLPPAVHYAVAGAAADYQCRGQQLDQQKAMATGLGVAGGMVVAYFIR